MLIRAVILIAALSASLSIAQGETPPASKADQSVGRLLKAINSHDAAGYTHVASHLVIMAAPDFAMPLTFELAQKAFNGCTLGSLGSVYGAQNPMKMIVQGDHALFIPTTMDCPTRAGNKRVQVDFQADDQEVYVIYPGGLKALLEAAQRRTSKPAAH